MKKLTKAPIEAVDVAIIEDDNNRLRRSINAEIVKRLASSMTEIGLKTPIVVRHFADRRSEQNDTDDSIVLVVGGHRLEAARQLGWTKIDAVVLAGDADDREVRLWEIAENLDRSELTQLERKEHIAEWVRLTDETQKGILSQVAKEIPKGRGQPEGGINAAARVLGVDKDEAYRSNKVAALAPEAKQVARDLHLDDNQAALLKAAREPSAEQQVARLRGLAEANEKAKQDRDVNKVIALTAAEEFAGWIMGNIGLNEFPVILDWLEGTKPKDVIAALRRMTKDPGPIMDGIFGAGEARP